MELPGENRLRPGRLFCPERPCQKFSMTSARPEAMHSREFVGISAVLLLASCGGGGCVTVHGHPGVCETPPPPPHNVSVYVAGFSGSGLALSYNGGSPVTVTHNGATSIATNLPVGTPYLVQIANQPTSPSQTCAIRNDTGTVGYTDVSVLVYCPQAVGAWALVATAGSITRTPGVASVQGSLSAYAIDPTSGALRPRPESTVSTGPAVGSLQRVPRSTFVWALNVGDVSAADNNTVSSTYIYSVDANSGQLTVNSGNPFFTLNGTSATPAACNGVAGIGSTTAVTFAPDGRFGYALLGANPAQNHGTLTFSISSGVPQALLLTAPDDCDTPTVVVPGGRFAYYSLLNGGGVDSLIPSTVDPSTGKLSELPGHQPPVLVESGPGPAEMDSFGRFLYSIRGNLLDAYIMDPVTGAVTDNGPLAAPAAAISTLFTPDGRFAYIIASGGIYSYSMDDLGQLSAVGSPIALQIADGQTLGSARITTYAQIDPSGQFLYVSAGAGSGQQGIYAYRRDSITGALTAVPGSPFAVTSQSVPLQIALY